MASAAEVVRERGWFPQPLKGRGLRHDALEKWLKGRGGIITMGTTRRECATILRQFFEEVVKQLSLFLEKDNILRKEFATGGRTLQEKFNSPTREGLGAAAEYWRRHPLPPGSKEGSAVARTQTRSWSLGSKASLAWIQAVTEDTSCFYMRRLLSVTMFARAQEYAERVAGVDAIASLLAGRQAKIFGRGSITSYVQMDCTDQEVGVDVSLDRAGLGRLGGEEPPGRTLTDVGTP